MSEDFSGSGRAYSEIRDAAMRCASRTMIFDGETVLLVADRSVGMPVSILGVIRAGKAYCLVEPGFPASRVEAMVSLGPRSDMHWCRGTRCRSVCSRTSSPAPMLADRDEFEEPPSVVRQAFAEADDGCLFAHHDPSTQAPSETAVVLGVVADTSPAYILFTSGSTRRPQYGRAVAEVCNTSADTTFLLKTSYVFDIHIQDICSAFAAGSTLVIAPARAHKDAM